MAQTIQAPRGSSPRRPVQRVHPAPARYTSRRTPWLLEQVPRRELALILLMLVVFAVMALSINASGAHARAQLRDQPVDTIPVVNELQQ